MTTAGTSSSAASVTLSENRVRPGDLLVTSACSLVVFAGYVKGTPLLSWIPVDLTVLASGIVAISLALVLLRMGMRFRVSPWAVAMLCSFIPALVHPAAQNAYTTSKVTGLLITLLAASGAVYLMNTSTRQRIWVWLLLGAGLFLALGLALAPNGLPGLGGIALEGSNTIAAAQMAGVAFIVAFAGALSFSSYRRIGALALCGIFGILLIAAGARGPLLTAAIAVCVITVVIRTNGRFDRFVILGVAAVAGLIYLLSAGNSGAARISAWISNGASGTESRAGIWNVALDHISRDPFSLSGIGWGQFATLLGPDELLESGDRQYPHNLILEVWIEAGTLAALFTTVFIVASLWRLLRNARSGYGAALLAVAVFAVGNSMVSGDINDNRLMWVSLAIAWVVDDRIRTWEWSVPGATFRSMKRWASKMLRPRQRQSADRPHDG